MYTDIETFNPLRSPRWERIDTALFRKMITGRCDFAKTSARVARQPPPSPSPPLWIRSIDPERESFGLADSQLLMRAVRVSRAPSHGGDGAETTPPCYEAKRKVCVWQTRSALIPSRARHGGSRQGVRRDGAKRDQARRGSERRGLGVSRPRRSHRLAQLRPSFPLLLSFS